jgi:hypothetical protein
MQTSKISSLTRKKSNSNDIHNVSFAAGCDLNRSLVIIANIFDHILFNDFFDLFGVATISDDPWNVLSTRVQGLSLLAHLE